MATSPGLPPPVGLLASASCWLAASSWAWAWASEAAAWACWEAVSGFLAWSSFCWAACWAAWADSSATWALAGSMVASTWPADTLSPAFTLTAVRTPPLTKLRSRDVAGCTVPVAETVCETVPTVADTSRVAVFVDELPDESMAP